MFPGEIPGGAALHCWGGGAAKAASSGMAGGSLVTKVNHFYNGYRTDEIVKEVGSGLNGNRRGLRRLVSDHTVSMIVVEHRERFCRFGFEYVEAALSARGARILVMEEGELEDDLVRDVTEVMTSLCARLYGRRSARRRAERALAAAGESP